MAALNSAAIHRLKRTWEQLPPTVLRQFRELDELTRPSRSHAALRCAMREGFDQPTVPYRGLYLTLTLTLALTLALTLTLTLTHTLTRP